MDCKEEIVDVRIPHPEELEKDNNNWIVKEILI